MADDKDIESHPLERSWMRERMRFNSSTSPSINLSFLWELGLVNLAVYG